MPVFTTEITSDTLASDNPIHQRHTKAYMAAVEHVNGTLLEVGCGEGRGVEILKPHVNAYTALERHGAIVEKLQQKYPGVDFRQAVVPPFQGIPDNAYDCVVSFQVIEHIRNDRYFLQEIYRVLKPGGKALITTPNIKMSLTRNPWHIREYTAVELKRLALDIFPRVDAKGISGNERAMEYYEMNKRSVRKFTRFDILKLQYRLPSWALRIPYDILNRVNRNKLKSADDELVRSITHEDWLVYDNPEQCIDLFYILEK